MKRCNACDEEFDDKYRFCPVDATPLGQRSEDRGRRSENRGQRSEVRDRRAVDRGEFHLTMIDTKGLLERLAQELRFVSYQLRLAWPALKSDPIGFAQRALAATPRRLRNALATPDSLAALATAMLVVFSAILALVLIGNTANKSDLARVDDRNRELADIIQFPPNPEASPEGVGIGAGSNGLWAFPAVGERARAPNPRNRPAVVEVESMMCCPRK